jgi:hypothetical protein
MKTNKSEHDIMMNTEVSTLGVKNSQKIIDLKNIYKSQHCIENSIPYIWVKKEGEDPLEWECKILLCDDVISNAFVYIHNIKLKQFNESMLTNCKSYEIYSWEVDRFFEKVKKGQTKFKPITLIEVATYLGKKCEPTEGQAEWRFYENKSEYDCVAIAVYENHAEIWFNNNFRYNFFAKKENWLKEIDKILLKNGYKGNKNSSLDRIKKRISDILESRENTNNIKKLLDKNPEITSLFLQSDFFSYDKLVKKNYRNHLSNNYDINNTIIFEKDENIIITGSLISKKSIILNIKKSHMNNANIIITGDLVAENLFINGCRPSLIVLGDVKISDTLIGASCILPAKKITCKTLISRKPIIYRNNKVDFQHEINPFNINKGYGDIFLRDKNGNHDFNASTLTSKLTEKEKLIDTSYIKEMDHTDQKVSDFERLMKNCGQKYCQLAGCIPIEGISEEHQVMKTKQIFTPSTGDSVVLDIRCNSGTYGYKLYGGDIIPVKVKNPFRFGLLEKYRPIKRNVDPIDLMMRYQWITHVFNPRGFNITPSPFGYFDTASNIDKAYQNEKADFKDDPHLALYWLLHFGLTLDKRYAEVSDSVKQHALNLKLEEIEQALVFFENTDEYYDLHLSDEAKGVFLQRRAYLLYICHSQSHRGGEDALNLWWKSITLYPEQDENLIYRIQWLKNNLEHYNKWTEFDEYLDKESTNIPLLCYVFACNPNTEDKNKYTFTNQFIQNINNNKNSYKGDKPIGFIQTMLWTIRNYVSDKELYRSICNFFYQGNYISEKYQEIISVIDNKPVINLKEIEDHTTNIESILSTSDRFECDHITTNRLIKEVSLYLSEIPNSTRLSIINNIKDNHHKKIMLAYLLQSSIDEKYETVRYLFTRSSLCTSDLKKYFGEEQENFSKYHQGNNINIFMDIFQFPEEDFYSKFEWSSSKEIITKLLAPIAHEPHIFDMIVDIIDQPASKNVLENRDVIASKLFGQYRYSGQYLKFSQDQIKRLLNNMLERLKSDGPKGHAISIIMACETPLAKHWVEEKLNNEDELNAFIYLDGWCSETIYGIKYLLNNLLENIEEIESEL